MLYLDKTSSVSIYEQIYSYYVEEILNGHLTAGMRLPATRRLAEDLAISRNTADRAYQQLKAEGYISSVTGSGFTVNDIPSGASRLKSEPLIRPPRKEPAPRYDFIYGSMSAEVFPYRKWAQCSSEILTELENGTIIPYPEHIGEFSLRAELCKYLYRARGVNASPDQVIITCGQQHSMEIICNMFPDRREFAMEEPGYDGIRQVFDNHGYRIIPIPVEDDGIDISRLEEISAGLLYLTPSHQFPAGPVLSIAKRRQLIEWAGESDTYIIEDDYDSELRYYTNPIPSMQSMDTHQHIIYTGTFSKSLSPAMRTAYIVLPEALLDRFYDYYRRYNSLVTPLHQLILARFMADGHYERHINRLRTLYRKKMDMLRAAIEDVFGNRVEILGGEAGLHILLRVDTDLSSEELISRAGAKDIRLYSTRACYTDPENAPEHELMMGFPTVSEHDFPMIMQTLKRIWESSLQIKSQVLFNEL